MQRKKLLTELDENELIESAKDTSNNSAPVYNEDSLTADILTYLAFFGVQAGEDRAAARLLYLVYKRWSKRKDHTIKDFNRICGMYLERQERSHITYFMINKSGYKLSQETQDHFNKRPPKFKRNKKIGYRKNVQRFVEEMGLVPGKYPFELKSMFYWYHRWTKLGYIVKGQRRKHITLKYIGFVKYIGMIIPVIKTKKYGAIIQLDLTQFKGTQDEKEILHAKFWFQNNYKAINKKTTHHGESTIKAPYKKRRKKVPGTGPSGQS
jgi:hypothetical protein